MLPHQNYCYYLLRLLELQLDLPLGSRPRVDLGLCRQPAVQGLETLHQDLSLLQQEVIHLTSHSELLVTINLLSITKKNKKH